MPSWCPEKREEIETQVAEQQDVLLAMFERYEQRPGGAVMARKKLSAHAESIWRWAEPYVQRRVRGLWANLAAKGARRNDGLNYTAWQFSVFVATGDPNREIAAKLLWRACEANGYLAKDGSGVVREVITRVLSLENWQSNPTMA